MKLSALDCRARFAAARVARLATISEDGSARLVPITFVVVGAMGGANVVDRVETDADDRAETDADDRAETDVIFSAVDHKPKSTTALARLRRIEREPRVCLLADHYTEDWTQLWWVRADADAEVLTEGTERDTGIMFLRRKYEPYRLQPPRDAVIRFVVRDWSGWTASPGSPTT